MKEFVFPGSFDPFTKGHEDIASLRSESDLRYELQMYATNGLMYDEYETIFIPSRGDYSYTSSSTVKEVALYGGDISSMVPIEIVDIVTKRFEK